MAHPHQEHRQHKHERARVHDLVGVTEKPPMHRAKGGRVHDDEAEDKAIVRSMVKKKALRADGGSVKARADKAVRRARGGHVKKGGKTNVNVIVAPHSGAGAAPMAPPMPPAGAAPPMPPKPPMPPALPNAGMAAPGLGGMPPRSAGGRAGYKHGGGIHPKGDIVRKVKGDVLEAAPHRHAHRGYSELHGKKRNMGGKVHDDFGAADMKPAKYGKGAVGDLWGDSKMTKAKHRAKGGGVEGKESAADKRGLTGIGARTLIQHSGNKSDTQNIGRGPVITRKTGGPIYADGREGKDMGPNLHAGANSGVGRRAKNRLARSEHWES